MPSHTKDDGDDDYDVDCSIRDLCHAPVFDQSLSNSSHFGYHHGWESSRQRGSSRSLMSSVTTLGSRSHSASLSPISPPISRRRSSLSHQSALTPTLPQQQQQQQHQQQTRPRSRSSGSESDRSFGSRIGYRGSRRNSCPERIRNDVDVDVDGFNNATGDDENPSEMVNSHAMRMSHISEQESDDADESNKYSGVESSSSWTTRNPIVMSSTSTRQSPPANAPTRGRIETMTSTRSSDNMSSVFSSSFEYDVKEDTTAHDDDDNNNNNNDNDATRHSLTIGLLGCQLIRCNTHPTPMCVAEAVVAYAPCFVCCARDFKTRTARAILNRLNVLLVFCTLYQMAAGIFVLIVFFSPTLVNRNIAPQEAVPEFTQYHDSSTPASFLLTITWTINGTAILGLVVGCCVFISAVFTWRIVRFVNLVGAVRYFWALSWATPFQTYCVFGLMDYFQVTSVWVRLWWRDDRLAWFRMKSCAGGTYNTLCTVPQYPDSASEETWCLMNYNSTDCTTIRDNAQAQTSETLDIFYRVGAGAGFIVLVLMVLAMAALEDIISKPLVQKSRQSNIAIWLSLPFAACLTIGVLLTIALEDPSGSYLLGNFRSMGFVFLVTAALLFTAAILGIYIDNATIKKTSHKRKQLAAVVLFIGALVSACALLLTSFILTVSYSLYLGTNSIPDSVRGQLACFFDNSAICTGCHSTVPTDICPQWVEGDVDAVVRTHCKSVATLSVIFMVYCFNLVRFGFNMRRHYATYQIEYV